MITLNKETCTGCGTCVKVCPHRVLEFQNKRAFLAAEERCIECGACQLNCHYGAIEVTKGTGCLIAIVREDILKLDKHRSACGSN
ncbi:MAG: 4Fe-4S dicluster domain-containing protein [Proteobacteria bacterium]|nr:4Fe-4S dicluster domain-containing protein [Pseudomonadota bacterium]